jgi:hypothetical protein
MKPNMACVDSKLTTEAAPRKRAAKELSDEDNDTPTRPQKQQRVIDAPGSTPYAKRLPNRGIPYSERRRRRLVESQGRVHSTIFRLPELVAQVEADAKQRQRVGAANNDEERPEADPTDQPSPVPETPRSGWSIRNLFSSVPFSFPSIRTLGLSRFGKFRSPLEIDYLNIAWLT